MHQLLVQVYNRMELMLSTVPITDDGVDLDKDTKHSKTILNVISIEEEWIIDPELRKEISLIDIQDPP